MHGFSFIGTKKYYRNITKELSKNHCALFNFRKHELIVLMHLDRGFGKELAEKTMRDNLVLGIKLKVICRYTLIGFLWEKEKLFIKRILSFGKWRKF